MLYLALIAWTIGPLLVLTAFGVGLFARKRTVLSALVAAGFAVAFASAVLGAFASYDVSYVYRSGGAVAAANVAFRGWVWPLARWGGAGGMWVASLSLLTSWLASRDATSPNFRWSGP